METQETGGRMLPEARRMLALRYAEGYNKNAAGWAAHIGVTASQLSNFENGSRRVPRDVAMRIKARVPGFISDWLWTGDEAGLSVELRNRLNDKLGELEREAG